MSMLSCAARSRAFLLLLLAATACEHTVTSDAVPSASLRFAVSYSAASFNTSVQTIRLTAQAGSKTIASRVIPVDPNAASWDVSIDVDPRDGSDIVVIIELINSDNGDQIVFSGRTEPIHIMAGRTENVVAINLIAGPLANAAVTGITVAPKNATVGEGSETTLQATLNSTVPGGTAVWTSLNPAVASVDAGGRVHAFTRGTALIVASAGTRADTAVVTVTSMPARVVVTPATADITSFGDVVSYTARVQDAGGADVPGWNVTWSSSDNTVLQYQGDGKFTALKNGIVNVTAALIGNPLSGSVPATVAQRVAKVGVPISITMRAGDQTTLVPVAFDARSNTMATPVINWTTSDASVATVNSNGVVTGLKQGTAFISATARVGGTAPSSQTVTGTTKFNISDPSIPNVQGVYNYTGDVTGENGQIGGQIDIRNQLNGSAEMLLTIIGVDKNTNQPFIVGQNLPGTITIDAQGHISGVSTTTLGTFSFSGTWAAGVITATWTAASPSINTPTHSLSGTLTGRR